MTTTASAEPSSRGINSRVFCLLAATSVAAVFVHGYHPFVEDAEIYVPGIKQLLNPALYPKNQGFFASHAHMTLFPNLIAGSARILHLRLEWILLAWHFACIFCLLTGCWRLGRMCFGSARAAWGGTLLIATLLTIPVAGTALYIVDQYVNPRSFSTASVLWIVVTALERKFLRAGILIGLTALIHPLMAVFALIYLAILVAIPSVKSGAAVPAFVVFPMSLFPPVSDAYRQAINAHSYFSLLRWEWYEWLGLVGPMLLFWWIARVAERRSWKVVKLLCITTIVFCSASALCGLVINLIPGLMRFAELQPLRSLLIGYLILFVILGGLGAEYLLKSHVWRWVALLLPLCGVMFYAQRQLFPATPHLELPGRKPGNAWVDAFIWIRNNTPVDAYFALNPEHMRLDGEDQHGFRAVSERSMLADAVKDSGAVTMFPALAQSWQEQVDAQKHWREFRTEDFEKLRQKYGVDWVVLQSPGTPGLECPYRKSELLVCQVPR